jgi:transposase
MITPVNRRGKQFRAVATRYDKRAYIFADTIDVTSIRIWLRDPVP